MSDAEFTLIAELDRRQDSVLQGIDDLNERILATLGEWTGKETAPTESASSEPAATETASTESAPNEAAGQLSKSA